ncbi:MAG: cell wall-binding repeat-containing protein, partial [Lachnospiraceae bacterium]|nr:cell wall-binding repeat-containing protein [Candidatus Equihabitans merdae]
NTENGVSVECVGDPVGIVNKDGSAQVSQTLILNGYTDPADIHTLTLRGWDLNTDAATNFADGRDYVVRDCVMGTEVVMPIPAVASEEFVSIKSADGISVEDVTISDGALHFIMPDVDVTLTLNYKPVIYGLTVVVNNIPEMGSDFPAYQGAVVEVENDWVIRDGIEAKWSADGQDHVNTEENCKANTSYVLTLTLDEESLEGAMILNDPDDWFNMECGETVKLTGAAEFSKDLVLRLVNESGQPQKYASMDMVKTDQGLQVRIVFESTGAIYVEGIEAPAPVYVSYGSSEADMMAALPKVVTIIARDGSRDSLPVSWEIMPGQASLQGYSLSAHGILKDDPRYVLYGFEEVDCQIIVGPAPRAEAPKGQLTIDGLVVDQTAYGDTITIGENGDYSVKLALSAANADGIRYAIYETAANDGGSDENGDAGEIGGADSNVTPDIDYTEPIEIGWGHDAVLEEETKVVTVKTYAYKDGCRDSVLAVFTYTLTAKHGEDSEPEKSGIERVWGQTRYETAMEAAKYLRALCQKEGSSGTGIGSILGGGTSGTGGDKFATVVLASGQAFPDALSGGMLAGIKDAPMLLGDPGDTAASIANVKSQVKDGGTVYLLGGTAAVPATVESTLKKDGYKVIRLSGETRYETNLEILDEINKTRAIDTLLLCNGANFADSLSAASCGQPIFLVGDGLEKAQTDWLKAHKIKMIYVIGGGAAVTDSVVSQVSEATACDKTKRLYGADRFETSVKVAEEFFRGTVNTAVIAYAWNFPDGLSGAPLAYKMGAPILLQKTATPPPTNTSKPIASNIWWLWAAPPTSPMPVQKHC